MYDKHIAVLTELVEVCSTSFSDEELAAFRSARMLMLRAPGLEADSRLLDALRDQGVEDWEGYADAVAALNEDA